MRIIFGICSWGLGHATRSLPIIRKLIDEKNDLTIITSGRSLKLLKNELGNGINYYDIPDYPMLVSETTRQFIVKSAIYWPAFIKRMESGLQKLKKIIEKQKCDRIISDSRYDMYDKKIPSFFISHQMRIMNPLRFKKFESGSEIFNLFFFKRFAGVIIPDYKKDNLSGDLSHNLKRIDENKLHYVGIISDFNKKQTKKDIDYLFSISGPEPQRTILEKKVLSQIDDLNGKIVVTLGKSEQVGKIDKKEITTYTFLSKEKREDFLNRSKLVISRSGYSTIMDLAVVGSKALFIPTPGQVEQQYLGQYHSKKKTFHCVNQNNINLKSDVEKAKKTTGIIRKCNVNESVENIIDIVNKYDKSPFV
jgi:uncharacterized protein (TIGR00661 family)